MNTPQLRSGLLIGLAVLLVNSAPGQAQTVLRTRFTPPVVPSTFTRSVLFEARISGHPASVAFNYDGVDRPMYDNGTHGDVVAFDGWWTIRFTAKEILSKNTADRVFRPFIGRLKPAGGSTLNVLAECWTPAMGRPLVHILDPTWQETDYIVNYVGSARQIANFDSTTWAQRFYRAHGDQYDFLNMVRVAGPVGNRTFEATKNTITGIGVKVFDRNAIYGSARRLQGVINFPLACFFDGAEWGFLHEIGHRWGNFLSGTPYASSIPHWPKGNVAINVMGFSIPPTNQGGIYGFTFTPYGSGYIVGANNPINQTTFNAMELYLMGLASAAEVPPYFVLKNQTQNVAIGQRLSAAQITTVKLSKIIAAKGPRVPDSTTSQKQFRCATIVVSEQLLDRYALAFYGYFARRAEARQRLPYSSGLATGTANPWYLATSRRSVMASKVAY